MAAIKRRLDRIEESLSPKQIVIASIEEANQFESLFEYAVWQGNRLRDPSIADTLSQRVEIGIRSRMQGEPSDVVQKSVRAAVRETVFLESLQLQVNHYFAQHREAIDLYGKLLLARAGAMFQEAMAGPLDCNLAITHEENLGSFLMRVFTLKTATEEVAARYFDNHQVLLKWHAKDLEQFVERINEIEDRFQSVSSLEYRRYHPGKEPPSRDRGRDDTIRTLKRSIDPTELVKLLVDLANVDTLNLMGDRQALLRLFVSMADFWVSKLRV